MLLARRSCGVGLGSTKQSLEALASLKRYLQIILLLLKLLIAPLKDMFGSLSPAERSPERFVV